MKFIKWELRKLYIEGIALILDHIICYILIYTK